MPGTVAGRACDVVGLFCTIQPRQASMSLRSRFGRELIGNYQSIPENLDHDELLCKTLPIEAEADIVARRHESRLIQGELLPVGFCKRRLLLVQLRLEFLAFPGPKLPPVSRPALGSLRSQRNLLGCASDATLQLSPNPLQHGCVVTIKAILILLVAVEKGSVICAGLGPIRVEGLHAATRWGVLDNAVVSDKHRAGGVAKEPDIDGE